MADFNSGPGRLLVALGFFAFVACVVAAILLGLKAQGEYMRGKSNINPLGWTAAGFVMLLALSLLRTCEKGPPSYCDAPAYERAPSGRVGIASSALYPKTVSP